MFKRTEWQFRATYSQGHSKLAGDRKIRTTHTAEILQKPGGTSGPTHKRKTLSRKRITSLPGLSAVTGASKKPQPGVHAGLRLHAPPNVVHAACTDRSPLKPPHNGIIQKMYLQKTNLPQHAPRP